MALLPAAAKIQGRELNVEPFYPLFPDLESNPTGRAYEPKQMILGVRFGKIAKAYPFPALGNETVINDRLAGNDILKIWYARERLAVPYFRKLGDRTLIFEKTTSGDPT